MRQASYMNIKRKNNFDLVDDPTQMYRSLLRNSTWDESIQINRRTSKNVTISMLIHDPFDLCNSLLIKINISKKVIFNFLAQDKWSAP